MEELKKKKNLKGKRGVKINLREIAFQIAGVVVLGKEIGVLEHFQMERYGSFYSGNPELI